MHRESFEYVQRIVAERKLNRRGLAIVEIGSHDVNGSVRPLFMDADSYVGVDVRPGPGVDVECDGAEYDPALPVDVVVTTSALEHCADPQAVIVNAYAMLKPGGWLVLTTVQSPWGAHSNDGTAYNPEIDIYSHLTAAEVDDWLAPFDSRSVETTPQGDILAWARKAGGK